MKFRPGIVALAVTGLTLTACTSGSETPPTRTSTPAADADRHPEGVAHGPQPAAIVIDAVNAGSRRRTRGGCEVELQQWVGIQDKLSTSLDTDSPPDVVEIGNTLTAKYADAGLLADLDIRPTSRSTGCSPGRSHPVSWTVSATAFRTTVGCGSWSTKGRVQGRGCRGPDLTRRAQRSRRQAPEGQRRQLQVLGVLLPGQVLGQRRSLRVGCRGRARGEDGDHLDGQVGFRGVRARA